MDVQTILVAILASNALFTFITFLINRHDASKSNTNEILKKLDILSSKIDHVDYKVEQSEAISCRARLLSFNKELISKIRHTHEEYGQVLEDCDKYERFCKDHPDFKNNKASLSIENIKRCFAKCEEDGDFL